MNRYWKGIAVAVALTAALPAMASAHDPMENGDPGGGSLGSDSFHHMRLLAQFPSGSPGARPINSDIAFWGDRAYVGNYNGFRIFDISKKTPRLITDFACVGPQNDPSVFDRDGDGDADLLILSVDRTMSGPQCGSTTLAHDDRNGWEGLRIFDISDERSPVLIKGVYQDCGSHTNTLVPRRAQNELLVLNSSYPLRPGPTCGSVRGPEAGRDPVHGVVQVVRIPLDRPQDAAELTELPIRYPGDADQQFRIGEHGLSGPGLEPAMRACHDIAVFTSIGLAAGACAEQAQLWRLNPATGLPDTANPLWTYDQPNVDFWHSATFTWDGKVVNFIDESFGTGCPTVTNKTLGGPVAQLYNTGNMFFLDTRTGGLLSEFRIAESRGAEDDRYCSSHLGNVVPSTNRYLLMNAYYAGGSSVIDFTDPTKPREIAFYDRDKADTWSTYWYEHGKTPQGSNVPVYANDGFNTDGGGFQVFKAWLGPVKRVGLPYLNPQVQDRVIALEGKRGSARAAATRSRGTHARGREARGRRASNRALVLRNHGG